MIDGVNETPAQDPAGGGPVRHVRGRIRLPAGALPAEAASILVAVEDVSRADAPSVAVGEQRLEHVPLGSEDIAFEVEVPGERVQDRARYTVRVHVDVTGTGIVERGDLVSTQSHPVLTEGSPDETVVPVKTV
jgi:putative lipoprotein